MNLAEVLHQRWAATEALNDLLPATSVHTGPGIERTIPAAVITKRSDRPDVYLSDGSSLNTVGVRIQVFHDSYDSAVAVLEQIRTAFDRTEFDLSGDDKVINMRRANDFEDRQDDGTWRLVIDFDCTVYLDGAA